MVCGKDGKVIGSQQARQIHIEKHTRMPGSPHHSGKMKVHELVAPKNWMGRNTRLTRSALSYYRQSGKSTLATLALPLLWTRR